jgi:hypothetical protein
MWLLIKNLAFTILVPGSVAVFVPLLVLSHPLEVPSTAPLALLLLFVGASIYAWCLWDFAITGRGTPAPIDPPKTLVVVRGTASAPGFRRRLYALLFRGRTLADDSKATGGEMTCRP